MEAAVSGEPLQRREELQRAGELIYTTAALFYNHKGEKEAARVIEEQRNPPAVRSLLMVKAQKRRPNEFMAAELISCAIKNLRFFPCNSIELLEIKNSGSILI